MLRPPLRTIYLPVAGNFFKDSQARHKIVNIRGYLTIDNEFTHRLTDQFTTIVNHNYHYIYAIPPIVNKKSSALTSAACRA